jgi:hypothetical protein
MKRLIGGSTRHNIGRRGIVPAVQALNTGTISLWGTLGAPDFDPITGTRSMPGSVWCVGSDNSIQADVLRYRADPGGDADLATLEGTFSCFPGF